MAIKVMIVDDEPLARDEMSRFVSANAAFQVAETASTGEEALKKLKAQPDIDVVFLDIEMPGISGLEVAAKLADWPSPPLVVFATAYHQYAIEAFEAKAIDYILKPYDPARLRKTFEHAEELVQMKGAAKERLMALEEHLAKKGMLKKWMGHARNAKDRVVINPEEVYYFYAKYTEVIAVLQGKELIVNSTLKDLLENLDASRFAQTHKAYIVNLDKVEKVSPMFSGNFEILLKPPLASKIPLSRRYARQLKASLGSW
ncbi:MAG TPA: LytTR family DNA-binding domain-containing protein [Verrucomicrobiae bacterium]|jgi:DNA-binding LytR/AlgR family response regulator|nr:LytTR family DNA-binding domain-containing protein [Verrucomicrobiae bacterium]